MEPCAVQLGRKVKVVKRSDRVTQEAQETAAEEPAKQMVQETARDMVATVTGWVTEFQQKRRMETTQALKTLRSLCRDAAPQAG